MATIILNRSPFGKGGTDYHQHVGRLIDWLTTNFPHGFGTGIVATLNGEPLEIDDFDIYLLDTDIVELTVQPADPVITGYVINAIISLAISYVVAKVFGPKPPKAPTYADSPQPSPVYSMAVAQNPARLGEAIPIVYGNVMTTPDYAAQPYLAYTEVALVDTTAAGGFLIEFMPDYYTVSGTYNATQTTGYLFMYLGAPATGAPRWIVYPTGSATPGLVEGTVTAWPGPYGATQFVMSPTNNPTDPAALNLMAIAPAGTNLWRITNKKSNVAITIPRERGNNGDQYLCALLCLGCGLFELPQPADIRIGDTTLDRLDPLTYSYACGGIDIHGATLGPLSFLMALATPAPPGLPVFWENVVTALEVGDQELLAFLDNTLYFPVGNKEVSKILIDIAFPRGLYKIDKTTGNFMPITVSFQIQVQIFTAGAWADSFNRSVTVSNGAVADVSPWRRSLSIQCSPGIYRVRLVRTSAAAPTDGTVSDAMQWIGLRGFIAMTPATGQTAYGDSTILALRMRANNLISENATSRIQVNVKRINPVTSSYDRNPAAAFVDVFTNTDYGAQRPLEEIDGDRIDALYTRWSSGSFGFNGVFTEQITVYEALKSVLVPGVAEPMLIGGLVSIRYEGLQAARTQLFSDENILQNSLSISYGFAKVGEPDGFQVEVRNPTSWKPEYYTYPENALNPEKVNLFGCADMFSAVLYARFLWQRKVLIRKRLKFDIEFEGNIPLPGDLIGVQYSLVYISASGQVISFDTGTRIMKLSAPFNFIAGKNYSILLRDQFGVPLAAIAVTPIDSTTVTLATVPSIPINDVYGNQPTIYALGETNLVASDWLVDSVAQSGATTFSVDASAYNPAIYDNSFSFLKVPL